MRLPRVLLASVVSLASAMSAVAIHADASASAAPTTPAAAKRGIASAMYIKDDPAKLESVGATWTYTWSYRVPYSTPGLEIVPMVRDARGTSADAITKLTAGARAGGYHNLLGFNEPDHANQANLTPEQAADLWPKLMATGLTLGSPAVASPTDGWLHKFMALVKQRNLRVDFIALHFYANINDPRAVQRIHTILALIRKHYGKPIWITELGIVDTRANSGSASVNNARARRFMTSVTRMLDAMPYVQRYAWMSDNVSSVSTLRWSSLYNAQGNLTPLGNTYRTLASPTVPASS